jgi:uncharacterized protein (DUF1501 family)
MYTNPTQQPNQKPNQKPNQNKNPHHNNHERLVVEATAELRRTGRLNRRQFLQIAGAVAAGEMGALALSQMGPLRKAFGSATGGGNRGDGVLLLIYFGGGNDGLNTVIPTTDPKYFDLRKGLAIPNGTSLQISADTALHPSLTSLATRFRAGNVAVLRNVGYIPSSLSHFSSFDHWAWGAGSGGASDTSPRTGWLGRWNDTQPENLFRMISFGSSVPLQLQSETTHPLNLPLYSQSALGSLTNDANEVRLTQAIRAMRPAVGTSSALGRLGDGLSNVNVRAIEASSLATPAWTGIPDGVSRLQRQLLMSANLINANLGVRVLSASFGGFDTHSNQAATHAKLLGDFDASLEAFFAKLSPEAAAKVTVLTFSEFGRRPEMNDSNGTDHGTSSVMFAAGNGVRGGIYGDPAPLSSLDRDQNLVPSMDFRRVYSSVLSGWLGADPAQILGAAHADLSLFTSGVPATTTSTSTSTSTMVATTVAPSVATTVASTMAPTTTAPTTTAPGSNSSTTSPASTTTTVDPSAANSSTTTTTQPNASNGNSTTTTKPDGSSATTTTTTAPGSSTSSTSSSTTSSSTTSTTAPPAATSAPVATNPPATTTSSSTTTTTTTTTAKPATTYVNIPAGTDIDPIPSARPPIPVPQAGFDVAAPEPTTTTTSVAPASTVVLLESNSNLANGGNFATSTGTSTTKAPTLPQASSTTKVPVTTTSLFGRRAPTTPTVPGSPPKGIPTTVRKRALGTQPNALALKPKAKPRALPKTTTKKSRVAASPKPGLLSKLAKAVAKRS